MEITSKKESSVEATVTTTGPISKAEFLKQKIEKAEGEMRGLSRTKQKALRRTKSRKDRSFYIVR